MSSRQLFAILTVLSALFAPAFMGASMASAAVPDHSAQMIEKGHCDPKSDEGENKSADEMACCSTTCLAVAVTPPDIDRAEPQMGGGPVASLQAFRTAIPAELATPPPRAA